MQTPRFQPMPSWSTRQVVYATLLVTGVVILFLLLHRFSYIVIILFSAIVLSLAIRPTVDWLRRRDLSRSVGVLLIYLTLFLIVLGMLLFILPMLVEQVEAIARDFPVHYSNFRLYLMQSRSLFIQQMALQLPFDLNFLDTTSIGIRGSADGAETAPTLLGILTRGFVILIAIFLLGFYWTLENERIIRTLLLWMPSGQRGLIREFIDEIEMKVGRFVLGQGVLCLMIGVATLLVYLLIGMPYALVLAILAGVLEAVPVFGPALGVVPALIVAFSTDASKVIWVVLSTLLIQGLENYLLMPRVTKLYVGVSSFVTLLSLAAFTSLLGLAGALLAIPAAAILQSFLDRILTLSGPDRMRKLNGRDKLNVLRYDAQHLLQGVRKQLRNNEKIHDYAYEMVDSLEAMAEDIDKVLANADWAEDER